MNLKKIIKIRKTLNKWLSPFIAVSLFLIIGFSLYYRFTNNYFYFFGNRGDAVLSQSMSYKNEKYLDFLAGHDDQIQKGDLVLSSKVNESTSLDVYDIVIFNNPYIGTDMHRIVEKDYDGQKFSFSSMNLGTFHDHDVFYATDPSFMIKLSNNYLFKSFEAVIYTAEPFDKSELYFNTNVIDVDVTVTSEQIDDYYKNIITYEKENISMSPFSITRKSYEYNSYFESVRLYGGYDECLITPDIMTGEEEQNYIFHAVEKYKIRGDAADTDDGWFYRKDIYSKVYNVVPKVGYFIRFISSPYGVIMIVGLALIPLVYSFVLDRRKSKVDKK